MKNTEAFAKEDLKYIYLFVGYIVVLFGILYLIY
jgi:hypothetical protein